MYDGLHGTAPRYLRAARASHAPVRGRDPAALGGRRGERLLGRLGLPVSDDTILRRLKRRTTDVASDHRLRIVGLDDWAWQKGQHHFGTIFLDLERRCVVDVLATRTADAAWLGAHPDIRIISRDRHGPYADGVRRGAPQAQQVADRFHLVLNLRGTVQQEWVGYAADTGRPLEHDVY